MLRECNDRVQRCGGVHQCLYCDVEDWDYAEPLDRDYAGVMGFMTVTNWDSRLLLQRYLEIPFCHGEEKV